MRADEANIESRPGRRAPIHPSMTVRQIAADYPACGAVFRRHGEPERSSAKFGHLEPLDHFAQRHGIPLDTLLAELSQAAGAEISREDPSAGRHWYLHKSFGTEVVPGTRVKPEIIPNEPFVPKNISISIDAYNAAFPGIFVDSSNSHA